MELLLGAKICPPSMLTSGISAFTILLLQIGTFGSAAAGCDQILTKDFGQFSTRNIKGKYANNLDCTYDINLMDQNKGIKLTWTEFDIRGNMPDCENDYMEIFIGCSYKSIGRYCSDNVAEGGSRIFDVYSPDNCLRLKFHTDSSTTGRGFEATYKTVDMNSCGLYAIRSESTTAVFTTPSWPADYPFDEFCTWIIEPVHDGHDGTKLAFMDFDLYDNNVSCRAVHVSVKGSDELSETYEHYSSSTLMGWTCGEKQPFMITSMKKRIFIRFYNSLASSGPGSGHRGLVLGYVRYGSEDSSNVGIYVGVVVASIIITVIVGYCWYRRRRARGQRVPTNPPAVIAQPAPGPAPPPRAYPMQPSLGGEAPPPSYLEATAGRYYPPPGRLPPGGAYPPPPGVTYPLAPPAPQLATATPNPPPSEKSST